MPETRPFAAVPTLDDLRRDPALATKLSPDEQGAILRAAAVIVACAVVDQTAANKVGTAAPSKFGDRLALTTAEAAEWLGMEEAHVQELCRRGVIVASKPGKAWLIRVEAIREWLLKQERLGRHSAPPAPPSAPSSSVHRGPRLDALPERTRRAV